MPSTERRARRRLATVIDLQEIIRDTLELEPLSESASKLAVLVAADDIDLDQIVRVVTFDPALSARALQAANAASSGALSEISTVEAAVVRLGPSWVLSLAMGACVQHQMESALPQFGLGDGDLWRHSVASSLAANELSDHCAARIPAEAPTAALLHDIGKLVLARHVRRHLILGMRRACAEEGLSGLRSETRVLSINHAELGGMIARHWGLPESIARGIAHHHHPRDAEGGADRALLHAVHLADVVAKMATGGAGRDYLSLEDLSASLECLGLPPERLRDLCSDVALLMEEVLAAYA